MTQVVAYDHIPDLPIAELLDWLIFSCTSQHPSSSLRVFWDLDKSVSTIIAQLPDHVRQALSRPPHRAQFNSHRLYFITSKILAITKSGEEAKFFDLSQYFPGEPEPSTLPELQSKADLLLTTISDLGIPSPTTLASPVAVARASGVLNKYQTTIPTVFDAPESILEAYELALQCTPREWTSNYQIGVWDDN